MAKSEENVVASKADTSSMTERPMCGLVMPIAMMGDYEESHWTNVQAILREAIKDADFEAEMVSTSADIGVIQARIVQNLYDNPIIVCDVSGKNPNVMFELGMRLAFDKPVIIVKDDVTGYSFDTSPIEHLTYRRDLRYQNILEFKAQLTSRIVATHEKATKDQTYSPFLKHFGKFEVATLGTEKINSDDYIIRRIDSLQNDIKYLTSLQGSLPSTSKSRSELDAMMDNIVGTYFLTSPVPPNPLDVEMELDEITRASMEDLKRPYNIAMVKGALRRAIERFSESDGYNTMMKKRPDNANLFLAPGFKRSGDRA